MNGGNDKAKLCETFEDLGSAYKEKQEYYKALDCFKNVLKFKRKLSTSSIELLPIYKNLSSTYL